MARRCRALSIACFSDFSWANCDVDKGWSEATRNVLERANLLWRDIFEPYMPPYMSLRFGIVERHCNHIAIKRAIYGRGFFFFSYIL